MTSKFKQEIQELLQNIINEEINVIEGCGQLVTYLDAGCDIIFQDFDVYYGKLLEFPLPSDYHLWEPGALEIKLKELAAYKASIIRLAARLLKELQ